ncbi:uncharacterized protein CTRU02_200142 [Colletotrichum truncatum]|uniref:Uncharacterized protein n=1 Tax=Colletotrichum truncatum TaxID=5467 RepID=A0ACC3ZDU2_COLTU|nr:uncharacterized protein CTRU02_05020 [Colletotrichum truncatum]KAF6794819.1 hypothetical protein CTRU02_05020 [Colletotrichum truncatum]
MSDVPSVALLPIPNKQRGLRSRQSPSNCSPGIPERSSGGDLLANEITQWFGLNTSQRSETYKQQGYLNTMRAVKVYGQQERRGGGKDGLGYATCSPKPNFWLIANGQVYAPPQS